MINLPSIESYPTIKKAALLMAYDNGCVNRDEPESQAVARADFVVSHWAASALKIIETDLSGLSHEQLNTFCCGEESEMEAISTLIDPDCSDLIGQIFDALLGDSHE